MAALYYFTFRFLITKFNVKTPGRDESSEEENEDKVVSAKDDLSNKAVQVLEALGGKENLEDVEAIHESLKAGVKVIATVHGSSVEDLLSRRSLKMLVEDKIFKRYIFLDNSRGVGTIRDIVEGDSFTSIREKGDVSKWGC